MLGLFLSGMGILLNDSFDMVPPPPKGFPTCSEFAYMPEEPNQSTSPILSTSTTSVGPTAEQATGAPCPMSTDCDEGNHVSFS